ncbi:MAG: ACT domain-containing protein [Spirochaetota bacterium]
MRVHELSIELENQPGRIHRVTNALAEAGINLRAMTVSDRRSTGVLRLIVSDIAAARTVLMNMHQPADVCEVLALRLDDRPGSLSELLEALVGARINVEYLYAFALPGGVAVTVLQTSDNPRCEEILSDQGVSGVDIEALFGGTP